MLLQKTTKFNKLNDEVCERRERNCQNRSFDSKDFWRKILTQPLSRAYGESVSWDDSISLIEIFYCEIFQILKTKTIQIQSKFHSLQLPTKRVVFSKCFVWLQIVKKDWSEYKFCSKIEIVGSKIEVNMMNITKWIRRSKKHSQHKHLNGLNEEKRIMQMDETEPNHNCKRKTFCQTQQNKTYRSSNEITTTKKQLRENKWNKTNTLFFFLHLSYIWMSCNGTQKWLREIFCNKI